MSFNQTRLSCTINFGISGLNNDSLLKQFYPHDLPEDWRLSYYSNEFQVLLINESDLGLDLNSLEKTEPLTSNVIIEKLHELEDEVENDVYLFFDTSKYSEPIRDELHHLWNESEINICLVNLDKAKIAAEINCPQGLECLFLEFTHRNKTPDKERGLLCLVNDGSSQNAGGIAAGDLRVLIEQIDLYASLKHSALIHIVFSSGLDALENCRNSVLLESMM